MLESAILADGGLPYHPGQPPAAAEPTLLAVLAMAALGTERPVTPRLLAWCRAAQAPSGALVFREALPERHGEWLTPLLALAFHHHGLTAERDRAVAFLLGFRSATFDEASDVIQNNRLVGWPWAPETFGWVEPTAWALLALDAVGQGDHPRAREGRALLLDRAIPDSGWNYGNRTVYAANLLPFLDTTALALLALAGHVPNDHLAPFLHTVEGADHAQATPYALAWTLLVLTRFGRSSDAVRLELHKRLSALAPEVTNLAHLALGLVALGSKRVLFP